MKRPYDPFVSKFIDIAQRDIPNPKKYVGGNWDTIGQEVLKFLKEEGMRSYHSVLDVGCGALRTGRHLIKFLDYDCYWGIDHHETLIQYGYDKVLDHFDREKRPRFVVGDNFQIEAFRGAFFNYAIAKSVFTHLTRDKIMECLRNLRPFMKVDGCFYATFFIGNSELNPDSDHDNKRFNYSKEEIEKMAKYTGWAVKYLPKLPGSKQDMVRFTPVNLNVSGVTIVTAAFREQNMDTVRESIRKQEVDVPLEWIIVNDGQQGIRDWRAELLKTGDYPDNLSDCWMLDVEKRLGRFGLYSRNIGAMCAKYDRVLFLDDDNEWPEGFVQTMVNVERNTGKIPMCDMRIIGKKEGSTVDRKKVTGFTRQSIDLGCLLYRKEHFRKYGYFEDTKQIQFDFDFMHKIFDGEGEDMFEKASTHLVFHHKRY